MTSREDVMEFCVLGPLEARVGGQAVPLSGAKQRAVLAVLLLRANEVVTVARLIDEVWGDNPPPSAAHSLEAYISRLRQLFNGHGPTLLRRGAGYVIDLNDASVDAATFVELHENAALAAAVGEHESVVGLCSAALGVWRGPALADVTLASGGRAEAERLEELRLHTYELRLEAELALGRQEQAIGELQTLVAQNPYRERFVAQLMLALYRCGRHAEALDVYEQTRRRLDEDLGLQPSGDLQQLSGQIVRQDSLLQRPAAAHISQPRPVARRTRRVAELVLVGSIVAAVMALTASGSSPSPSTSAESVSAAAKRIALVLPMSPDLAGIGDRHVQAAAGAVRDWGFLSGYSMQTLVASGQGTMLEDMTADVEWGNFAVAIVVGQRAWARRLAPVVRHEPNTHFIFVDNALRDVALAGAPNVTAIRFAEDESSHLVGYLSGLVQLLGRPASARADVVSVVAGAPSAGVRQAIKGFTQGVRRSRPGVRVLVDYSRELDDPTRCEQLANDQVDSGSDVVFALAGQCGKGALAVAKIRGVWGIGTADDGVMYRGNVLAVTQKDWWSVVSWVLDRHGAGTLRPGEVVLGLDDDYAVTVGVNSFVNERLWSKVVERCSEIRRASADDA